MAPVPAAKGLVRAGQAVKPQEPRFAVDDERFWASLRRLLRHGLDGLATEAEGSPFRPAAATTMEEWNEILGWRLEHPSPRTLAHQDVMRRVRERLLEYLDLQPSTMQALVAGEPHYTTHAVRLERLLEEWTGAVLDVERGYALGVDSYTNDLEARHLLEQLMAAVPGLRVKLEPLLEPWDRRFLQSTTASGESLGHHDAEWWSWREPKKANWHEDWEDEATRQ